MNPLTIFSKCMVLLLSMVVMTGNALAQEAGTTANSPALGETKLVVVGNAQGSFSYSQDGNQFNDLAFKPIFLWSLSNKFFIESELEVATDAGQVEVVLEYANMVYFINNYLAVHFGRFLPKFGSYRGKFGEAFFNRFPTDPIGFGDGGIGPMTEMGLGVQGGTQLGAGKINYDFYVSNGPQLMTGSADAPDEAGQFEYEAYLDNNKSKAIGGRIGILPISNSSLELGLSFEHAGQTGDQGSAFQKTRADMYAVDLNYYNYFDLLKSTVRFWGEWKKMDVGTENYPDFEAGTGTYTFDNRSTAYYVQASLRPSGASKAFVSNLELALRYSQFDTPKGALWGGGVKTRTSLGIDYWLRWNGVLKLAYQWEKEQPDLFIAQLVYGF